MLGKSLRAAAKPMIKAARSKVPVESGTLKKSLGTKIKKYKSDNVTVAIIGPRKGYSAEYQGKKRVPYNYAHLVHDGFIDKNGVFHSGSPFLTEAYNQEKGPAEKSMADKMGKEIEKEAAKK